MITAAFIVAVNAALSAQAPASAGQNQPPPPDRPLARIVQNLVQDFRRLGAIDSLVMIGAGGLGSAIASNSDRRVDRWTVSHPAPGLTVIGRVGGDGWVLGGTAIGTWLTGKYADLPLVEHVGSDLIRVQVLNGVLTTGLKVAVDRTRPNGGRHAFPSGHTSATFATAGVIQQHFGWKAGAGAYTAATFVAWTRVRDRAHWVSDVVFGASVGLASALAVTRGHDSRNWSVTPVVLPGGGGLVVRW